MSSTWEQFIALDAPALLTALAASLSCALLGNFLVLRKLSLMGDAISHAVLPGIVVAFLLSGSRGSLAVFLGAALAGILTAILVELVRRLGRLEEGAAMGVVFSLLFALGILLIEQAAARNIDLDADCLLHGQLETIFWYPPEQLTLSALKELPTEVFSSLAVLLLTLIFLKLFFKELTLSAFDPALASALGFNAAGLHYLLMIFVALAVVASFEAVGSILVIAMIICPAATARFCTDSLRVQIALSAVFTSIAVIGGYWLAAFALPQLGYAISLNAAGMMTVVAGLLLSLSAVLAPGYGLLPQRLRQRALAATVLEDDILAYLFRQMERAGDAPCEIATLERFFAASTHCKRSLRRLENGGYIDLPRAGYCVLSEKGSQRARGIVRKHRLWERFLVDEVGLEPSHVHESAERLEHFTAKELADELAELQAHPGMDPHGKHIPEE